MASSDSGSRRNKSASFTRLHLTEGQWDGDETQRGLIYDQGLTRRSDGVTRTRRGSIVMSTPQKDGTYVVDILHSERTRQQLEHQEGLQKELDSGHGSSRVREKFAKDQQAYVAPGYPETTKGHIAEARRFQWQSDVGFHPVSDSEHHVSGKVKTFSSAEQRWLDKNWPGESHEERNHSEARYAMAMEDSPPERTFHQLKGGHDMCRNCQHGLSALIPHPVNYVGLDPFHSQGEWAEIPDQHFKDVPGTSITRMRPEEVMTSELRQDHVDWATSLRKVRGKTS